MDESRNPFMDSSKFPTHLARTIARVNRTGRNASADTFLSVSYVIENSIKTMAIALCSGMHNQSAETLYKCEHEIFRADGLGTWAHIITECAKQRIPVNFHPEILTLSKWLTQNRNKPEDVWVKSGIEAASEILKYIDVPIEYSKADVLHLINLLVIIRNKTKAHGAVSEIFYERFNDSYLDLTKSLIQNCPIFHCDWFYFSPAKRGKNNVLLLKGLSPIQFDTSDCHPIGVYFKLKNAYLNCKDLLITDIECQYFFMPNGSYHDDGSAEYIDYSNGKTRRCDASRVLKAPATLPASATEGLAFLDVFDETLGNLPPMPDGYIARPLLENELEIRLLDTNHHIITLHGRGGIGKTCLALKTAYKLASSTNSPFESIIWLSARDLELKPSGSTPVKRSVTDIIDTCRYISKLLSIDSTSDAFAELLHAEGRGKGILFIFDNFETFDDPRALHEFLDTHTHIPNKILITSRERSFKADYPIKVGGLEYEEAKKLIQNVSRQLSIEPLVIEEQRIIEIFNYTEGHAYAIRVLLGEIAQENKWIPIKSLFSRRGDILDVVFERSFNKLCDDGRRIFLTICIWRSGVSELALRVILGLRGIDVEAGLRDCIKRSLINEQELSDGEYCYFSPELARIFAKKKIEGDPDRFAIIEDQNYLRGFGIIKHDDISKTNRDNLIHKFICYLIEKSHQAPLDELKKNDELLVNIAEEWPKIWLEVVNFRKQFHFDNDAISYALRRAVEEMPFNKTAWLDRSQFSLTIGDDTTYIASLISAVESDPQDVYLLRNTAYELCKYIDNHKYDIPKDRRGVYLASVREYMVQVSDLLDATGLSRLAWLFLLEGNEEQAREFAKSGLSKEPHNEYCKKILQRII